MSADELSADSSRTNCDPVKLTIDDPMRAGVHSLWEQDLFVDYKIQVENREFQVHKVILASMSDYFRAMLSGGLAESERDKVVIEGVKAAAVEILIKFIYTNHLDITPESVSEILAAAMYFQIKSAIQICSQFMINNLDIENWFDVLTLFRSYGLTHAIEDVKSYVIRNIREIANSGNNTRLPYNDFYFLVHNWQSSEVDLFLFIVNWVKTDLETRFALFDDLLCQVRFCLMSPAELAGMRQAKEMLMTDRTPDSWNALTDKALDYHKQPIHRRVLDNSDQTKVRSPPSFVSFSRKDSERGGFFYEPTKEKCFMEYAGLKIPHEIAQSFSEHKIDTHYWVIEVNNFLVVIIDEDMQALYSGETTIQWYIFDPRTMQWGKMANLGKPIHWFTLAHDKKNLYALGGSLYLTENHQVTDNIERYDFQTDTWTTFSTLVIHRLQSFAACILNNGLYVSGGFSDDMQAARLSRMDRLDLASGEWESKAPMLKQRIHHSMQVIKILGEEVLLLIHSSDKVIRGSEIEFYSPSKDQWMRCEFSFNKPPPEMEKHQWIRGNSVYVSDNLKEINYLRTQNHCAVVTFPEEGNEATVEYLEEYKGRFYEPAFHTVLSIAPHIT